MATQQTGMRAGAMRGTRSSGYGLGRTFTETKAGIKTTEFLVAIAMIAAILIAAYVGDANLNANDGWRYASWVAAAYIVSRGLAKLGTREPYDDRVDEA